MTIILAKTKLSEAQQTCVDLLEETLKEARKGRVYSVAIALSMETAAGKFGYATVMAGSHAADLNLGCDSLKKKILEAVEDGNRK